MLNFFCRQRLLILIILCLAVLPQLVGAQVSTKPNMNAFHIQEESDRHTTLEVLDSKTYQDGVTISDQHTYNVDDGWDEFLPRWEPIPPEEYIRLNMAKYFQNNQSWSSDVMQTLGHTIGQSGCTLTSFAMIADYFGYQDNPGQVNVTMGNGACPFVWGTAESRYNLNIERVNTSDLNTARTYIRGALRNGHPVMVCYQNQRTEGHHYVVAYQYMRAQYDENSPVEEFFYIHDPSHHKDYSYLEDYLYNDSDAWRIVILRKFYP